MRNPLLLLVALGAITVSALPAFADFEDIGDTVESENAAELPFGYVRSVDAFTHGFATANSLGLAAEYASARGYFNDAVRICKMALSKNDDDLDIHKAYAEALEGKLGQQRDKDPDLMHECVREWLIVLRTERGPEKGLNGKNGLGLPGVNKLYEDEEHSMVAKVHLKSLVGSLPKRKETNDQYMLRTCGPAALNVSGKILNRPARPVERAPKSSSDPLLWMQQ